MHHLYLPLIAILVVASQADTAAAPATVHVSTASDCATVVVR